MAKVDVVSASGRVLVLELVPWLLAQLVEAKRVKGQGVRVAVRVLVDAVTDDHDESSFWDDLASRKLETPRIGDDARNID